MKVLTKQKSNEREQRLTLVPEVVVPKIDGEINESSGVILYDNMIWTFNDKGGRNILYAIDYTGTIKKEIELENGKNVDWEDIAQDDKYIYVGDFGNNKGHRKNLRIYRIEKKDIKDKKQQSIKAGKIKFEYSDQQLYEKNRSRNRHDCEAMIEFNDALYLFTKDRVKYRTTVYSVPKTEGEYVISPIVEFEAKALITGAGMSPDKKQLALIGYRNYIPVIWIFKDFPKEDFFSGKHYYSELRSIYGAQTEGICFKDNSTLLISCEKASGFPARVFQINLNQAK